MKTSLSAPAPDDGMGNGQGTGRSSTPAAIQHGNQLKAQAMGAAAAPQSAPAQVPADPHYDTPGLRYGMPGLRYAVGDPVVLPTPDGGRVKMGLNTRNNGELVNYVANHILQMTNNPIYPSPLPSAAEFQVFFDTFTTAFNNWLAAKTAFTDASTALEQARVGLVGAMNTRGAYVQSASNGNTNAIVSSGLNVRAMPRPVGILPPPTDLAIELNGTPGLMMLYWTPTPSARGYNVQCSPADTLERNWSPFETTTQARYRCTNMELGKMWAFRIAAIGGSTGQSEWSAEVIRMAA